MASTKFCMADYDVQLPVDKNPKALVYSVLKDWAKAWCFQMEKAPLTGYLHWQVRLSLIKKRRLQEIRPLLLEDGWCIGKISQMHVDEETDPKTGKKTKKKPNLYGLKKDTRVEGPYRNDDPEPAILTSQIKPLEEGNIYLWEQKIVALMKCTDHRHIEVLYCPKGNTGKSAFIEWCEYKGYCEEIPMMRLMQEIMQCAFTLKASCYAIDMPRGMKKSNLADFYSGIECIKNGLSYDQRYAFKKRRQDRPNIWIMTNVIPDVNLMSRDRWRFWCVGENQDLVTYTPPVKVEE